MRLLPVFLVGAAVAFVGPGPCPSTTCWTFDADTSTCSLKSECTSLKCGSTSITMGVKAGVFGDGSDSHADISPALSGTANGDGFFEVTCNHGDCGSFVKADGKDELVFTIDLDQKGSSRTRSDNVDDKKITLDNGADGVGGGGDDLVIITAPFGVGVSFTCNYPMSFDLTSSQFSVQDVTISGTQSGSGGLSGGFTLTAAPAGHSGGAVSLILGSMISVTASWSLSGGLSGYQPHFSGCTVTHDSHEVKVMDGGCLATGLGATGYTSTVTSVAFDFKTFTVEGANASTKLQTVTCNVNICACADANNCANCGETAGVCATMAGTAPGYGWVTSG